MTLWTINVKSQCESYLPCRKLLEERHLFSTYNGIASCYVALKSQILQRIEEIWEIRLLIVVI